jgi:hypothetical protein
LLSPERPDADGLLVAGRHPRATAAAGAMPAVAFVVWFIWAIMS